MRKRHIGRGTEYELVAADDYTNGKKITCHCGKTVAKGKGVKSTYVSLKNSWLIRYKCYCSVECVKDIIKSKKKEIG